MKSEQSKTNQRRAIKKPLGDTSAKGASKMPNRRRTASLSTRQSTKLAAVITLLRRPKGASIDDLMNATGWQAHSVRGAISGTIKKKLGLSVTSEKAGDVRSYRIAG